MDVDKQTVSLNTFSFDLFKILSQNSIKNEFYSPFSVLTALNMALLGAKNNTEKELFEAMRYSNGFTNVEDVHKYMLEKLKNWNENNLPFTLDIANRVLVHKSLKVKQEYVEQLQKYYDASTNEADFENQSENIVETCNEWVNLVTKGKIPTILESLDPRTVAVLLNAIYFKGVWEEPFDEELTALRPFYNFGDEQKAKDVHLMYKSEVDIPLFSTMINGEEVLMIEMAYKGDISMNILTTKSVNGLQKILPQLNYDLVTNMKQISRDIDDLWIPRFKIETDYELKEPLMQLGIKDAFQDSADFGGIRDERNIKISKIIHKASVEVNEEGTVAAAATAMKVMLLCAKFPSTQFRVDHPFVCFIKDIKTGLILFIGKIEEL